MTQLYWAKVKQDYFLSCLNLGIGFTIFYLSGNNPLFILLGLAFVTGGIKQLSRAISGHVAFRKKEERLLKIVAQLFDNRESALGWIHTPKRALGGETPWDYACSEEHIREIEQLVGRLEYGIFS